MSAPQKNDIVAYRAFAGDMWLAKVTDVTAGETFTFVDIEVLITGEQRLFLRAVRWWGHDDPEKAGAGWPKKETA